MSAEMTFDNEATTALFEPDILLPYRYLATFRASRLDPERGLMCAVLEDAMACFERYLFARNRREQSLFSEAEQWLLDPDNDYFFSFVNLCELLAINPNYLRGQLLRWKTKKLAQRQKIELLNIALDGHESSLRHQDIGGTIKKVRRPYRGKKLAHRAPRSKPAGGKQLRTARI